MPNAGKEEAGGSFGAGDPFLSVADRRETKRPPAGLRAHKEKRSLRTNESEEDAAVGGADRREILISHN